MNRSNEMLNDLQDSLTILNGILKKTPDDVVTFEKYNSLATRLEKEQKKNRFLNDNVADQQKAMIFTPNPDEARGAQERKRREGY
ncbi:MAG: hypothetical protein HRT72_14005 [Flavobacteriales bacterium]|nr:hypothetical protein [Flavobacteriales bacterium]